MSKVRIKLPKVGTVRVAASTPHSMKLVKLLLILLFIVTIAGLAYAIGAQYIQLPFLGHQVTTPNHVEKLRALKAENSRLIRELAQIRRTAQVEHESVLHVQKTLQDKDLKILKLNEELAFYRGLLAPEKIRAGVRVRDLAVRGSETPGEYSFDLLLTQSSQSSRAVKGKITLSVDGRQDGEIRRLDIKNIENEGQTRIKYSFKYFQRLYGSFVLPDNFDPLKVIVEVAPDSKGAEPILVNFSWDELITGG